MNPSNDPGRSNRRWAWLTVVFGCGVIYLETIAATHNAFLGLGAVALMAAFMLGLLRFQRRKAEKQAAAIDSSGAFAIDGGLDFDCLPGRWPQLARETLNPAGAANVPSLPVRLSIASGLLQIDKKQSWGTGRHPFHAQVPLAQILEVRVGRAAQGLRGSSLTIVLQNRQEIRIDVPLDADRAEHLADRLRRSLPPPSWAAAGDDGDGLEVTSALPPNRTSSGRAGLLMMAVFVPFAIAMAGAPDGPFADFATMGTLFYGLWLMMRRPPTMAMRLAILLAIAALAFAIDTASTGEPVRLAGTLVCLALAAWFLNFKKPDEPHPPDSPGAPGPH